MTITIKGEVQRALDRFNSGDLDGYLQLYSDDVKAFGVAPQPLEGRASVAGFYQAILGAFQPLRVIADDMIQEDNQVAVRFSMEGRHVGDFMGTPASGKDIRVEGITTLRFAGGQCVERHSKLDLMSLLAQIGALPG